MGIEMRMNALLAHQASRSYRAFIFSESWSTAHQRDATYDDTCRIYFCLYVYICKRVDERLAKQNKMIDLRSSLFMFRNGIR